MQRQTYNDNICQQSSTICIFSRRLDVYARSCWIWKVLKQTKIPFRKKMKKNRLWFFVTFELHNDPNEVLQNHGFVAFVIFLNNF